MVNESKNDEIYITKTSTQARREKELMNRESTCPNCRNHSIGTEATRLTGFFNLKTQKKKCYSCIWCGTEWNTGWRNID